MFLTHFVDISVFPVSYIEAGMEEGHFAVPKEVKAMWPDHYFGTGSYCLSINASTVS